MTSRRLRVACALALLAALTGAARAAVQQDPQRPTFRTGTNLVRVDAYPSRDGRIIEGLTAEDFEILEDGVAQAIQSFQFVRYERNAATGERRDPNSQREGFQLAADPSYRVFVIYLDNLHVDFSGSHAVRLPLLNFMNRVLGPHDLFGVLTTAQSVNDLMLGQRTEFIEEQLTKWWDWGRGARVLEGLGGTSGWSVALWFVSGSGWLGGKRPVDLIEEQPDAVAEAARRSAEPVQS